MPVSKVSGKIDCGGGKIVATSTPWLKNKGSIRSHQRISPHFQFVYVSEPGIGQETFNGDQSAVLFGDEF